jgi:RND family efflux transporter MFP subunit
MVERGSYVGQGSTIAQLDSRMATLVASESQANLETARTQKALAEQECGRFDQLFKKGAISQAEYDRQTASCKTAGTAATAAEQREQQARQNLGDATIRAPFAGLVSERYISVGEYVRPDTKVVHLVDIDPLRLELTIPEQNMGAVKQGQTVQFQVGAFPNQTFSGVVHYIGPAVRSSTRDLVFEAVVSNKQKLLRPGLFATARLDLGKQTLPVVPKTALRKDGETLRAFAIVNNHLEERVVQTGITDGDKIAILNGLKAGDKIVAQPTDAMSDGQDVE